MANELTFQVKKRFPKGAAIEANLDMDFSAKLAVTVLFGPSGSGKTTILRCLAGLEQPEGGFIHFNGQVWFNAEQGISLSPQQRRIGFLFQEYALFPHLTIVQNLEFGLGSQSKVTRHQRVAALANLFEIEDLLFRYPGELSGGQLQRAALARTVAPEPQLLLLDEPLSALDGPTRGRLRTELRRLLNRIGIPALVVTHDRAEAIALGDQLAVVVEGRIQQTGSVEEVFSRPANPLIANSMGVETVVAGRIVGSANGLLTVQARRAQVSAVDPGDITCSDVYLCIRAEEVMLSKTIGALESARNHLSGWIVSLVPEGSLVRVGVDCGIPLVAFVTKPALDDLDLKTGDMVTAVIKATSVHLIPRMPGDTN